MILSNITVPLLGIVDTAVIGHLGSAHYLAGIALGSAVISILFWLAGFLRMSTTGLVAQAYGQNNLKEAQHGDKLTAGWAYIAPGGLHLYKKKRGKFILRA